MTRLRIDADGITALGSSLSDHARALEEISALPQIGEGFIGYATDAIRDAVSDWERARVDICARLDALAEFKTRLEDPTDMDKKDTKRHG